MIINLGALWPEFTEMYGLTGLTGLKCEADHLLHLKADGLVNRCVSKMAN